jgi:hypothetical protein
MFLSQFDHECFRERLQPRYHMEFFCKVEHVDKDYLDYRISAALGKTVHLQRLGVLIQEYLKKISIAASMSIIPQKRMSCDSR